MMPMNYIIEVYKNKDFPNVKKKEIDKKIKNLITKTRKALKLKDDDTISISFFDENNVMSIYE